MKKLIAINNFLRKMDKEVAKKIKNEIPSKKKMQDACIKELKRSGVKKPSLIKGSDEMYARYEGDEFEVWYFSGYVSELNNTKVNSNEYYSCSNYLGITYPEDEFISTGLDTYIDEECKDVIGLEKSLSHQISMCKSARHKKVSGI